MYQYFSVTRRGEPMANSFKACPHLAKVIDLSIENEASFAKLNWLHGSRVKVNDCKTTKEKRQFVLTEFFGEMPKPIGAAMMKEISCGRDGAISNWPTS
jgi:hypothetical protein